MSLILWFTVWLTIPQSGLERRECESLWQSLKTQHMMRPVISIWYVTQNLVEIFKDLPSKKVNINPTPHKIHEVEIHRISWRETTRLSLFQCPNIKHVFLLFLILFFCNFHLAEHGDWLIMVQIYQRPCGVLQTRGRTQLCQKMQYQMPTTVQIPVQCLKHGVNFEQILPKSTVAPKKEPSQVDAKKFFWEIQKCAQSTARSCSIIWQRSLF